MFLISDFVGLSGQPFAQVNEHVIRSYNSVLLGTLFGQMCCTILIHKKIVGL